MDFQRNSSRSGFHSPLKTRGRTSALGVRSPLPPDPATVSIQLNDTVGVPGGMFGEVKYIGGIQGKPGEYIGVDLSSDFAGKGKNSGAVEGVQYFTPSVPMSGLFVPVSKITLPDRAASRPPSALARRPPSALANARPQSPSLAGLSTPQKTVVAGASTPLTTPRRRTSMASMSMTQPRPASRTGARSSLLGAAAPTTPSRSMTPSQRRRSTMFQAGVASRLSRQPEADDDAGAVVAAAAAAAAADELAAVRAQLADTQAALRARDSELSEQSTLLVELEHAVSEFQKLSTNEGSGDERPGDRGPSPPPTERELELRTLVQDRERKLADVKAEFETKRTEFRETIGALEQASEATTRMYEQRIADLESRVGSANDTVLQIGLLEQNITELERTLDESREIEQQTKARLDALEAEVAEKDRILAEVADQQRGVAVTDMDLPSDAAALQQRCLKLEADVDALEKMVEAKVFREDELEREVERLQAELAGRAPAPLAPKDSALVPKTLNVEKEPWCEMCESAGHDILDCRETFRARPQNENVAQPAEPRKLWCALCERDGHASMECPYEPAMF
ncbi:uncharacterized protein V1510DRAFT_396044 [Dipodascopsis tothii]|uniref:uncharacterized protein n=1 Tax=Dipodascopsis tothii TaxID=44089 RepID=UPI0034CE1580